ncbi:MAG: tetratricopeptide repeat protein, partial [Saprospiraceae bacterium]
MRNFTTGCWMFLWSCFCVAQAPIDTTEASVLLQRARMEYESQSIEAAFKSVTLAQQLFTKTLGENHPRVADCIYIQAMCYFMQDELRKALQLAQQAYKLHQKSKESPLTLAKDIDLIGHIQLYQGDDVGAEQQFDIAYNIRKKHLAPDDKIMTRSLDKYFLLNMYRRREDKGIDILLQIMAIDKKHYAPDDVKLALTYADLGEAYKAIGNFRNANKYYQMAVPIFEKAKSPHLATVKNNIGTLYLKQCDMHQALLYFLDALAMDIMKYGAYSYETSLGYRNLGDYYLSKGDYYAALEMYNEVQCIRSTHSDLDPLTLAPVLEDISTCWLELGDKQTAWEYLKQASKIKKQHLPPIDIRMSDNYGSLGDWYYKQHQYTTAQQNYQKAVSIREKLESVNPIDVATLNQKIAECYLHLSNPLQALRIVRSEYQKMNISENTPIEELPKLETAILLLSTQATALRRRYEQLHIIDTLQAAEATLKTAIVLIEKLRNSYRNGESINLLSDYFQKIYDEALQTNMELFYYTQVEKYLLYAFALADANRSAALANAVQRNIIQDESAADIQQRCLYYERKIAEATPAQKRIFEDSLRHYQQQYYAATKNLKTDFTLKPPDLPQMQKQLKKEGAAVITYAMTDDSLYIFVLTGNKLYHHTQQLLSSLQKDVQTFNQSILEYAMHLHTSSEYLTYFDNVYTQTAQQLYKYLVQPIEQYLPERVCIVPTGVLG